MVTQRTVRQVRRVMLWSLAAVLSIMAIFIAVSTWRVFGTLSGVRAERYEAEAARDILKARTAELQASVGALKTDRGIEEEIRSRYPLVKPGEIEFVFVDKDDTSSSTRKTTTMTFWGKVKVFFGF
jgi:cell division protein FtsB